jgi:hypothetical protein
MPTVYRVRCTNCLRAPDIPPDRVAGYVAHAGRNDGVVIPADYLALQQDNGTLVCLPHPIEDLTLQNHAQSWAQAMKDGRLLRVTYKVCTACGTINEEKRVHDNRYGCLLALVILIATFCVAWSVFELHSYFLAWASLFVAVAIAALRYRLRWSATNAPWKLTHCAACRNTSICTLDQATKRPIMCPHCKTPNMRYTRAGIS